jgi:hypothetical protein
MSKVWSWVKGKVASRKFLVTVGAIVGAVSGTITWDEAIQITMVWLGAQGAVDVAKELKN